MKVKQLLISIASVVTFALVAVVVATNQNTQTFTSFADVPDPKNTKDLSSTDLSTCALSAYTYDGKTDSRKFRYVMEDGKYMDGALLYSDCGHQTVGDNLSEPLVLNNNGYDQANASDFNILFSAHGLRYARFEFNIKLDKAPTSDLDFLYRIKYTTNCDDLYTGIEGTHMDSIKAEHSQTVFYSDGLGGDDKLTPSVYSKDKALEYRPESYAGLNAVDFQINFYSVPDTYTLTITLKSFTLKYDC